MREWRKKGSQHNIWKWRVFFLSRYNRFERTHTRAHVSKIMFFGVGGIHMRGGLLAFIAPSIGCHTKNWWKHRVCVKVCACEMYDVSSPHVHWWFLLVRYVCLFIGAAVNATVWWLNASVIITVCTQNDRTKGVRKSGSTKRYRWRWREIEREIHRKRMHFPSSVHPAKVVRVRLNFH